VVDGLRRWGGGHDRGQVLVGPAVMLADGSTTITAVAVPGAATEAART
jgi:hypothetical protein